jgi:hypothetical protein
MFILLYSNGTVQILHAFVCISHCCGAFWALSWILFIILWFSRASQRVLHFSIRLMLHCIFIFEPTTHSGQQPFRANHPFGCQKLGWLFKNLPARCECTWCGEPSTQPRSGGAGLDVLRAPEAFACVPGPGRPRRRRRKCRRVRAGNATRADVPLRFVTQSFAGNSHYL